MDPVTLIDQLIKSAVPSRNPSGLTRPPVCVGISKHTSTASEHWAERNDCTVRAVANGYAWSYEKAHSFLKQCGRVQAHGVYFTTQVAPKLGLKPLAMRPCSLLAFIQTHRTGSYICLSSGHAFAVRDGVLFDQLNQTFKNFKVKVAYAVPQGGVR